VLLGPSARGISQAAIGEVAGLRWLVSLQPLPGCSLKFQSDRAQAGSAARSS